MSIDIGAELFVDLNDNLTALNKHHKRREEIVTQPPFGGAIALTGGNGTLDVGGMFEPPRGLIWSIRRLSATGYTAGSVSVTIDGLEPVAPFPSAGVFYFGQGNLLLEAGHRLVFTATGITGAVNIFGRADQFPYWYLSEYLD